VLPSHLASGAEQYVKGVNARQQLDLMKDIVKKKSAYFTKYEIRAKAGKIEKWDIPNGINRFPTIVVLRGADGSTNHCVTIVNGLVFDSNCDNAMPLNKATLDWCCNCPGGFLGVLYALRFWH